MNTNFYLLFSIVMISRLIFQSKDAPITMKECLAKTIFEITGSLVFIFDLKIGLLWLALAIIALNGLAYFFDNKRQKNIFIWRFLVLILYCFALGIFFPAKSAFTYNSWLLTIKSFLEEHNLLFFIVKKISWKYFLVFLSGMLLAANEVNHIVRFVLSKLKVEPHTKRRDPAEKSKRPNTMQENSKDTIELKRGKLIGIIERILMFYFVIDGNLTSIGFILAAKSFTRFKELDDKNFAEYVLIGTLLSTFLAIFIGIMTKRLIT